MDYNRYTSTVPAVRQFANDEPLWRIIGDAIDLYMMRDGTMESLSRATGIPVGSLYRMRERSDPDPAVMGWSRQIPNTVDLVALTIVTGDYRLLSWVARAAGCAPPVPLPASGLLNGSIADEQAQILTNLAEIARSGVGELHKSTEEQLARIADAAQDALGVISRMMGEVNHERERRRHDPS